MLKRKLRRDLCSNWGSNVAIIIVIAIGIMCYHSFSMVMDSLHDSRDYFYELGKFPDAYVELNGVKESVIKSLERIEGVYHATGRRVIDIRMDESVGVKSNETKYVRLITKTNQIAQFQVLQGQAPREGEFEIAIDNAFADKNHIKPGDEIIVIFHAQKKKLRVSAIVRSPEYIYALRSVSQIYPDPLHFAIAFTDSKSMEHITKKSDFNQVIYHIKDGYDKNEIRSRVEFALKPYGIASQYLQEEQMSNEILNNEMNQLRGATYTLPLMFLMVSAMILYIMIGRVVEKQRGQIGLLKAFGLSDREVFIHYLSYSLTISLCGAVIGIILGYFMRIPFLKAYGTFFNMPFIESNVGEKYAVISILLAAGFGCVSGFHASVKAMKLSPCEAMRSKAPDFVKSRLIEKCKLLMSMFTTSGKMSVRNIFRNPARSVFVVIGIVFTFAFAVIPWAGIRLVDEVLYRNYEEVEKYDVKLFLRSLKEQDPIINELRGFEGLQMMEGILEIPSTLTHGHIKEDVGLIGLQRNSALYRIGKDGVSLSLSGREIVLSKRLAEKLKLKKGDVLQLKSSMFKKNQEDHSFYVKEIIHQSVGMGAYVDKNELSELIGGLDLASSIIMRAYPQSATRLKETYRNSAEVDGVKDVQEMLGMIRRLTEDYTSMMQAMALLSIIMGFAIIYNSYSIILSEREKEFASLLVLGMSEKEVISIIKLEQWLLFVLAIPIGIPVTMKMFDFVMEASSTDMFSLSMDPDVTSFLIGVITTIFSIWFAQCIASFKIKKIVISDALKADE